MVFKPVALVCLYAMLYIVELLVSSCELTAVNLLWLPFQSSMISVAKIC
jgi:hypothetical protein